MFTSNYARIKRLPQDHIIIAISRKPPYWYKGRVELDLAPTSDMLKMSRQDYDAAFQQLLSRLDPAETLSRLGENCVLLCYESPNTWCHRRAVAEWFETNLGIVVPEFGFPREEILPYSALPDTVVKNTTKSRRSSSGKTSQPLF